MDDVLAPGRRVHVVGAGGAGMSALCVLLAERGCLVSGCDARDGAGLRALAAHGVATMVGHDASHVAGVDVVTATPAMDPAHPELAAARAAGTRVLGRAEVMGALGEVAAVVGFAGTHGKTTTTSMAAHAWSAAGADPGWLVGADVPGLGAGGRWRDGDLLVEVDESYGTFALLAPAATALTAVDPDHLDYYGDVLTLERAFADLLERTSGPVVLLDHPGARRAAEFAVRSGETWVVGRGRATDVVIADERFGPHDAHFTLATPSGTVAVDLAVPGALNVDNAALVLAMASARGLDLRRAAAGVAAFAGAPRRFEVVGTVRGTAVVVDYAHLPAEIAATVAAARAGGYASVRAVFQPHRVTRTQSLAASFAGAFRGVTDLVVTDLYRAGEENPARVSGALVADAVANGDDPPRVAYVAELDRARSVASAWLGNCDLVLVLGAGDVAAIGPALVAP